MLSVSNTRFSNQSVGILNSRHFFINEARNDFYDDSLSTLSISVLDQGLEWSTWSPCLLVVLIVRLLRWMVGNLSNALFSCVVSKTKLVDYKSSS